MSIHLAKEEAHAEAGGFATELPEKIRTQFAEEVKKEYELIKNDWSGDAANKYLPMIQAIEEDLYTMANHIAKFGARVSEHVVNLDQYDKDLGSAGQSNLVPATPNEYEKKFEEYKSNTNEMNITPASIDAGKRIIRIAENLEKLLNEIDERQENLKSYWKTGGNVEDVVEELEETKTTMRQFKSKAEEILNGMYETQAKMTQELN